MVARPIRMMADTIGLAGPATRNHEHKINLGLKRKSICPQLHGSASLGCARCSLEARLVEATSVLC